MILKTLAVPAFLFSTVALAQQPSPDPGGMPPPPPPARSFKIAVPRTANPPRSFFMIGGDGTGREGMHEDSRIVPPGTWWRDPSTIARLNLSTDQQKRMDETFRQNRLQLVDLKAALEKEQINLEPLLNANPPDSAKALSEISRIADLRADLEKSNAKMLLGLRSILTADQWTKLQAEYRTHPSISSLRRHDFDFDEDIIRIPRMQEPPMPYLHIPDPHVPDIHFEIPASPTHSLLQLPNIHPDPARPILLQDDDGLEGSTTE